MARAVAAARAASVSYSIDRNHFERMRIEGSPSTAAVSNAAVSNEAVSTQSKSPSSWAVGDHGLNNIAS